MRFLGISKEAATCCCSVLGKVTQAAPAQQKQSDSDSMLERAVITKCILINYKSQNNENVLRRLRRIRIGFVVFLVGSGRMSFSSLGPSVMFSLEVLSAPSSKILPAFSNASRSVDERPAIPHKTKGSNMQKNMLAYELLRFQSFGKDLRKP